MVRNTAADTGWPAMKTAIGRPPAAAAVGDPRSHARDHVARRSDLSGELPAARHGHADRQHHDRDSKCGEILAVGAR